MTTVRDCPQSRLFELKKTLASRGAEAASMAGAAQSCMDLIHDEFAESFVLARVFLTVPFEKLPARDREFVSELAAKHGVQSHLNSGSLVLSLLGTRGLHPAWNDRYSSQGHLGIPLVTSDFVSGIPMVSKLMIDMGIGVDWIDKQETDIVVRALGKIVRVFYVKDASTARDAEGRHIVTGRDFVSKHGVKTVFGLGGSYVDGTILTTIFFSKEELERLEVEKFLILFSAMKNSLVDFIPRGAIYPG